MCAQALMQRASPYNGALINRPFSMQKLLIPMFLAALALAGCAPPLEEGTSTSANTGGPTGATPAPVVNADPNDMEALRQRVSARLKGTPVDAVRPTPLPGIYEIQSGLNFGYVTLDGRYLIEGDLNDMETGRSLTEDTRRTARMALVNRFSDDQSIVYAPEGAPAKYTVTVFTDIDCGYCRKLHQHIAEYNADGIAVRYLFFPRTGPETPSYFKAEKVWCAADRKAALTEAKLGAGYEGDASCPNPVMDHLRLASQLGLRGTPAIILPDGEMIPGYQTPAELLKALSRQEASRPS